MRSTAVGVSTQSWRSRGSKASCSTGLDAASERTVAIVVPSSRTTATEPLEWLPTKNRSCSGSCAIEEG